MFLALTIFGLKSHQLWLIAIGALVGGACGILGCFLILKRLSLMGDAISHAVLPGIVLAVIITGSLNSFFIFIGAGIIGLLTPFLIDSLKSSKLVHEDASMGAVFTFLFAIGVIMVSNMGNIDLDADCVLYGQMALTPLDTWILGEGFWTTDHSHAPHKYDEPRVNMGPRAVWILGITFLLNTIFVTLFYKELKISTFDETLALTMGLKPRLMHYLLMGLVAITTISSFESVGAIIVVAMFIAPGASAYLWTERLHIMLILSVVIGILCSILGYGIVLLFSGKVSPSGCMAVAAGIIFSFSFLFSPNHGIALRFKRRRELKLRLHKEHILIGLYRNQEQGKEWVAMDQLANGYNNRSTHRLLERLIAENSVEKRQKQVKLTNDGLKRASKLLRAHRLWETYIHKLGLPADHIHRPADEMEHFLSPELCQQLENELDHPKSDPHGKPIP